MKQIYLFLVFLMTATGMFAANETSRHTTYLTPLETSFQKDNDLKATYVDSKLILIGNKKNASIEIYNLLGRKVVFLQNVNINGRFSKQLALPVNNIYIVKISAEAFSKTVKIVAK